MGFATDNPTRAARLKQLSVQAAVGLHEVDKADKALSSKGTFVQGLLDDVLSAGDGADSVELYLKTAAQALEPEEKDKFLRVIEDLKADVTAIDFVTVMVGLFGAEQAWKELDIQAHLDWQNLWTLLKVAAGEDKSSILWMSRNPKAVKTASLAEEALFKIEAIPSELNEQHRQYLNQLRAQIQIAAGYNFRTTDATVLTLASGNKIDEFVSWCEATNLSPETHLSLCRLAAKYTLTILRTMHELLETLEGIVLIRQVAEAMPPSNPRKRQTMAALAAQRTKLAQETAESLKNCTWEKTWYALRDKDVSESASIEQDVTKDELVQCAREALAGYENISYENTKQT